MIEKYATSKEDPVENLAIKIASKEGCSIGDAREKALKQLNDDCGIK